MKEILLPTAVALLALAVLSVLVAVVLFRSCVCRMKKKARGIEDTSEFAPYLEQMRAGAEWFLQQDYAWAHIRSYDGLQLAARILPAENARGVLLLMHGYHGSGPRDFSCVLQFYHELGFHIVLPDQRASGASEGKYICFGVKERYDCRDWAVYATERFGGQLPIILDGVSMGATTVLMATALELPPNVRGVIADCGFTSPWEAMRHVLRQWLHLPAFPLLYITELLTRWLAGFSLREYSTIDAMGRATLPVFFAHGQKDKLVAPHMTEENYQACVAPKMIFRSAEAGHGMSFLLEREQYAAQVIDFLLKDIG